MCRSVRRRLAPFVSPLVTPSAAKLVCFIRDNVTSGRETETRNATDSWASPEMATRIKRSVEWCDWRFSGVLRLLFIFFALWVKGLERLPMLSLSCCALSRRSKVSDHRLQHKALSSGHHRGSYYIGYHLGGGGCAREGGKILQKGCK